MSGLDKNIRSLLEQSVDNFISDAHEMETQARDRILKLGIEPNLETVLSYLCGLLMGLVVTKSVEKHGSLRKQDEHGATELLKRRAWELRQVFINTRVE